VKQGKNEESLRFTVYSLQLAVKCSKIKIQSSNFKVQCSKFKDETMKNAIFYLFSFLLIQLFASSLISLLGLPFGWKSQSIPVLIASSVLSSVLTIALFTWRKWTPVNRRYMLSRPWLVLIWSGIASYGALIPSLGLQDLLPEMPNLIDSELEGILKNRWGYFAIGLAAPVAEEFVFRGAVLRSLLGWAQEKGRSHWVAILVSALLFSVAHFNPAQMIHAFLIGILLGRMYYRKGRLIANKDNTDFFEYDNLSARDVTFKVQIKEAAKTAAFQTYINDTAMQLLQMQAINVQQYLEVVNLPYAKELLQIIQRDQAQQMAMQQELLAQGVDQQQVNNAQQMLQAA
jgi:membrane protease YdiL (CAAX protease family)